LVCVDPAAAWRDPPDLVQCGFRLLTQVLRRAPCWPSSAQCGDLGPPNGWDRLALWDDLDDLTRGTDRGA
jgi:hypothetical protein